MFNRTLAGVERQPTHTGDYVLNAQHVIDALAGSILHMPLAHITGESIVRGESVAIINLINSLKSLLQLASSPRQLVHRILQLLAHHVIIFSAKS